MKTHRIKLELDFSDEVTAKKREAVTRHIMEAIGEYVDEFVTIAVDECGMKGDVQYELSNDEPATPAPPQGDEP